MKTAVVLFNLGGPDSRESIRPFLFNFFMDPNILRLPQPFRFLLAKWISETRSKGAAGSSYAHLGYKSPLLENSLAQAAALEKVLNASNSANIFKTFVCMRYWHPMAEEVARAVKDWAPDKIILLPLYPQFSTATTRSAFQVWDKTARRISLAAYEAAICCYPFNEGFIRASAELVRDAYEKMISEGAAAPRILFSAHGLPESIIKDGDPYQWQCEKTAEKIVVRLGIAKLDWAMCYQSRVGRQKWIGPSTEQELRRAAKDKKPVLIYPLAFTQEHVETLVEIEIEYRELAHELGVPAFARIPTVGTHPAFIDGLAGLVRENLNREGACADGGARICPESLRRCCMQESNMRACAHA